MRSRVIAFHAVVDLPLDQIDAFGGRGRSLAGIAYRQHHAGQALDFGILVTSAAKVGTMEARWWSRAASMAVTPVRVS